MISLIAAIDLLQNPLHFPNNGCPLFSIEPEGLLEPQLQLVPLLLGDFGLLFILQFGYRFDQMGVVGSNELQVA